MNRMRKILLKILLCTVVICGFGKNVQAQGDVDQLISQYKSDGNYLINGYVTPFMKTLSLSLNQGWYNTAKPHKVAGVDLTVTVNAMYIPNSDKVYNVSNLQKLELVPGQNSTFPNGNVPTIFGKENTPVYHPKGSVIPTENFNGPKGIDLKKNIGINALPVPMAQLGFGLPKGFDVKLRFSPSYALNNKGHVQLLGLGVMHDLKQYIPGIKLLPFDLSAFVGYTQVKLDYDLSGNTAGSGQKAIYNISSTTIQAVISKKVSVLTGYASVGYNIAKSKLAINGTYDTSGDGVYNAQDPKDVKDPFNNKFSASGARITAGARLKLAVFTFHADYTVQKYNTLTVGFGISVR